MVAGQRNFSVRIGLGLVQQVLDLSGLAAQKELTVALYFWAAPYRAAQVVGQGTGKENESFTESPRFIRQ